jgi:radical SAM superfamily enzyme YgiQ (UPF0313 family)
MSITLDTKLERDINHSIVKKKIDLSEIVSEYPHDYLKGLNILFINMPLRESALPNTPPQGPALLASRLREYGANPLILDLNSYRFIKENTKDEYRVLTFDEAEKLFLQYIAKYGDQDVIAFSGMITTLRWQEFIATIARKYQPKTFLLSGGGLATQLKAGLFQLINELDAVAHSEGDDIILLIGKHLIEKKNNNIKFNNSSNPYFIGSINGIDRYVYAGDRPKDLERLPFAAWDLLETDVNGDEILERYIRAPAWGAAANNSSATPFKMKRSLTTVSSRGCPYACTFCYRGGQGERRYGVRHENDLAKEVKWLIDTYNIDFVAFPDDNFAVDRKRIAKLPEAFKDFNIRWGTHTRLDEADDRLEGMADSGCVYIGFGAESASPKVLNSMKKGGFILKRGIVDINGYAFPKTMVDGIINTKNHGIHSNCTWIMGYPGEELDDLKTSVAFIQWQKELATKGLLPGSLEYKIAIESINENMFVATAYPGTEMFKHPKVQSVLNSNFKINFDAAGEPIMDEHYKEYILELDDATKLLANSQGEILNFGEIPDDQFTEIRDLVEKKEIHKILDL